MYTLVRLRSSALDTFNLPGPRYPLELQCSFRGCGHVFTALDFQSYTYRCKHILGEIGRGALLQGGILARIAREFISIESALDGPSHQVLVNRTGASFRSESNGYEYWDDTINQTEIDIICGTYYVPTGKLAMVIHKDRMKAISWFPPPSVWAANGFAWLEWTEASEFFFRNVLKNIQSNQFQPLTKNEWRQKLRGFGGTRKLLEANAHRSRQFLNNYCPIRRTI
ncbi:hypothetical protein HYPSUDRAFT_135476 [Hypholoma sublateritium FD-334 SS-4]|uniref:Uncharacterized protein n=1 Tax=Hypholoma sublateritium (strain FD-334 SS-4) TaxID=945553 RepID=A0A0D2P8L2_HYPSF|nr:hypothetical protein HYPSUDRAFT_135476 [Hypholoma sublateritium FD-334 SS-4]